MGNDQPVWAGGTEKAACRRSSRWRLALDGATVALAYVHRDSAEPGTAARVACDGGEGALGHPRVWLTIPADTGWVECGYCDKRYVIDRDHAHDDH